MEHSSVIRSLPNHPDRPQSPLLPGAVPDDWYTRFFDGLYLEIDRRRKPTDVTLCEVAWIQRTARIQRPCRILDLCCGYGRHAIQLAKLGHEVVGLDLSPVLLNEAELESRRLGVHVNWQQQDIRELREEGFDLVISMHTSLGYFPTARCNRAVLSSIKRALAPNGQFVFDQIDLGDQRVLSHQATEHYRLSSGLEYRKHSVCDNHSLTWFGAYVFRMNCMVFRRPFRIQIMRDARGKTRGRFAFSAND